MTAWGIWLAVVHLGVDVFEKLRPRLDQLASLVDEHWAEATGGSKDPTTLRQLTAW